MYKLSIGGIRKRITVDELRKFFYGNYYKQIRFLKETSYGSMKQLKKKDLLLLVTKLTEKTTWFYTILLQY